MGHYAGTLYINSEKVKLIEDCLENKRLFCLDASNLHFSTALEYFGDGTNDKVSKTEKVVASISVVRSDKGKYRLQIVGYVCNLKTMSEKLVCIKKYSEIFGDHQFTINNRPAIVRVSKG